jgi:hypothetical protein
MTEPNSQPKTVTVSLIPESTDRSSHEITFTSETDLLHRIGHIFGYRSCFHDEKHFHNPKLTFSEYISQELEIFLITENGITVPAWTWIKNNFNH